MIYETTKSYKIEIRKYRNTLMKIVKTTSFREVSNIITVKKNVQKNIIFPNRTQFSRETRGLRVRHKRLTLFHRVCRMNTKKKIQITEHTTPRSLISDMGSKSRSLIF